MGCWAASIIGASARDCAAASRAWAALRLTAVSAIWLFTRGSVASPLPVLVRPCATSYSLALFTASSQRSPQLLGARIEPCGDPVDIGRLLRQRAGLVAGDHGIRQGRGTRAVIGRHAHVEHAGVQFRQHGERGEELPDLRLLTGLRRHRRSRFRANLRHALLAQPPDDIEGRRLGRRRKGAQHGRGHVAGHQHRGFGRRAVVFDDIGRLLSHRRQGVGVLRRQHNSRGPPCSWA